MIGLRYKKIIIKLLDTSSQKVFGRESIFISIADIAKKTIAAYEGSAVKTLGLSNPVRLKSRSDEVYK